MVILKHMPAKTRSGARKWGRYALLAAGVGLLIIIGVSGEAIYRFNARHAGEPYRYGVSFSAEYAGYLEVNPRDAFEAILKDLKPSRVRLMSYWNQVEAERDRFGFEAYDWQLDLAQKYGAKVTLAIGLRQPRYPECHYPEWAKNLSDQEIYGELIPYITAVVERYKDHPALESYQLENEALLTVFGECRPFSRDQLIREFNLVKQLDPAHPVALNVSNEYGLPLGEPTGDKTGFSVYRRVFDARVTKRFVNYPFPSLWFRNRAAIVERYIGGTVFIHELQAEPWGMDATKDLTLEEQDFAFSLERLKETERFARATGIKQVDFWGAEWWYWRKVKFGDEETWETAKEIFNKSDN